MSEESYLDTLKQIEILKQKAQSLKDEEIAPTIERFKRAIKVYGIKPTDVFSPEELSFKVDGKEPKVAGLNPPKYFNGRGDSWSGFGRKPNWFLDAIAQGISPESMLSPDVVVPEMDFSDLDLEMGNAGEGDSTGLTGGAPAARSEGAMLLNARRLERLEAMRKIAKKEPRQPIPGKGYALDGHYWTGVGPRPKWFKEAIASGRRIDELRA